ncbi:MAG: hypothetical protein IOD12_08175 [Silvanigrellales bacterium]|jgi:hypothetical protein|nr:hypothetical protein [Silvanigrellales bacterium]
MKLLFLFFTQSEGGAPGFLSRKGEEAAEALAESLSTFVSDSLGLDLAVGFASRARSLEEDIRWKAFRSPGSQAAAVAASLRLFSNVLLLSGAKERTLQTAEALASGVALPVVVDARLDRAPGEKTAAGALAGALSDALAALLGVLDTDAHPTPQVVLVGTSLEALDAWLPDKMPPEALTAAREALSKATLGGLFPTVFACGFERGAPESPRDVWLFD